MANLTTSRYGLSSIFVTIAAIVLLVLHQDIWFWHDATLVFGFIPIGLAYHALYSILAACLWAVAIHTAWPSHLEAFAESEEDIL